LLRLIIGVVLLFAASAAPLAAEELTVTVTHYAINGTTYGGTQTHAGVVACSWNIPLWSTVIFPDGRTYVCEDRGQLGNSGWIDIWTPSYNEAIQRGRYTTTVSVIRP
jgi:3D (Asp-Asp-Asp) domain-containing protein